MSHRLLLGMRSNQGKRVSVCNTWVRAGGVWHRCPRSGLRSSACVEGCTLIDSRDSFLPVIYTLFLQSLQV